METTAFNYATQRWESGAAASTTRCEQLEKEIAILTGPLAKQFAYFIGLPESKIAVTVDQMRAEVATLNA